MIRSRFIFTLPSFCIFLHEVESFASCVARRLLLGLCNGAQLAVLGIWLVSADITIGHTTFAAKAAKSEGLLLPLADCLALRRRPPPLTSTRTLSSGMSSINHCKNNNKLTGGTSEILRNALIYPGGPRVCGYSPRGCNRLCFCFKKSLVFAELAMSQR